MKCCVQCSVEKILSQAGLEPGTARSVGPLSYLDS